MAQLRLSLYHTTMVSSHSQSNTSSNLKSNSSSNLESLTESYAQSFSYHIYSQIIALLISSHHFSLIIFLSSHHITSSHIPLHSLIPHLTSHHITSHHLTLPSTPSRRCLGSGVQSTHPFHRHTSPCPGAGSELHSRQR